MALKLDERATCCKAVLVGCRRDQWGHDEAFLEHGKAYQAHPQHVPHVTRSAPAGPFVLDAKQLPQVNPVGSGGRQGRV